VQTLIKDRELIAVLECMKKDKDGIKHYDEDEKQSMETMG
jgi:hypothetical protein